MEHTGVKFIRNSYPLGFSKTEDGKVLAKFSQDGEEKTQEFDGVLLAIGRYAVTKGIHLENAGVSVNAGNGKIICDEFDRSNVEHIWAVGDVSDGKPELTPVAIVAGELLARRLFGGSDVKMDYQGIPTTVFTPLEYSCCGLSEERAYEVLGEDNVEVYHSTYLPLEWNFLQSRKESRGYVKLICDKLNDEKVIGIHYLGPQAGEVMQGFAVALKAGANKRMFDMTVGIHPTCAEEFTRLKVTKASGKNAEKGGC